MYAKPNFHNNSSFKQNYERRKEPIPNKNNNSNHPPKTKTKIQLNRSNLKAGGPAKRPLGSRKMFSSWATKWTQSTALVSFPWLLVS